MVPFPPVIYNGRKHAAERSHKETIESRSYELFGVDEHCIYYGTYRCTKMAAMDWGTLKSLGQGVSAWFFCLCRTPHLRKRLVCECLFGDNRDPGWSCGSSHSITHEEHVRNWHLESLLCGITMRRL